MDLVEEYARLAGYDRIPETLPEFKQAPAPDDAQYLLSRQLSQSLRASGFSEALSLAFAPFKEENAFYGERSRIQSLGLETPSESVALLNPLSEEQNRLRAGLSFGLWKTVERNFHQGCETGRLFEIGPVTRRIEKGYAEELRLSLVVWGHEASVWKSGGYPLPLHIKQALSSSLAFAGPMTVENLTEAKAPQFLHFGQAGQILLAGVSIGFLGALHPVLIEEAKIRVPVAIAEITLERLDANLSRARKYVPFSRMQAVRRDLSFVVSLRTSVGDIEGEIRALKTPYLREVELFDVFTGGTLAENTKALGLRFEFQSSTATLKDEEVNASMEKISNLLKDKFSAQAR
jgi:phenylalanyl-tRNA synthetase beta chain